MSRSRSRLSAAPMDMDWRGSSRSRSRPPPHPGQPFDQHTLSSSWAEGRFNFAFDDATSEDAANSIHQGAARSFDASFIAPSATGPSLTMMGRAVPGGGRSTESAKGTGDEHTPATSPSIPIPGLASQLRFGSPPVNSSLDAHTAHVAAATEEAGGDLGMLSSVQFSGSNPFTHGAGVSRNMLGSAFQPASLPGLALAPSLSPSSALSAARQREYHLQLQQRQLLQQQFANSQTRRAATMQQALPGQRLRKTSFAHTVARNADLNGGAFNANQNFVSGLSLGMNALSNMSFGMGGGLPGQPQLGVGDAMDPILVCDIRVLPLFSDIDTSL